MRGDKREPFRLTSVRSTEAPRHRATFGCRLVGLSGSAVPNIGLDRTELLSPLLSSLSPEERLALRVDYDAGTSRLSVMLEGTTFASSPGEVVLRQKQHSDALHALVRAQFPGFVFRTVPLEQARSAVDETTTVLRPLGRRTAPGRTVSRSPGPQPVEDAAETVLLPPMGFSPQRLVAAIELLKARNETASISIGLRRRRFDAASLRLLRSARDEAVNNEPRSSVEAVRQLVETVSDDALMTALLHDGGGIELDLTIVATAPLDETACRLLCHAVYGAEPLIGAATAELDLSTIYPRAFALPRAVAGLVAAGLAALERPPLHYDTPATGGCLLGHTRDGRNVEITERDRARHTYVIGSVGTGKSSLLLQMIAADIAAGKGLLLLDPHGDLWNEARRLVPPDRQKDLVVAHLGDPAHAFGMNVLQGLGGDPAVERDATVNGLLRLFKNSLWPGVPEAFGPMFEMYFRNALLLLMEAKGEAATILEFERVFQDSAFRNQMIDVCQTPSIRDFWRKTVDRCTHDEISLENIAPYIISKMSPFTSSALLGRYWVRRIRASILSRPSSVARSSSSTSPRASSARVARDCSAALSPCASLQRPRRRCGCPSRTARCSRPTSTSSRRMPPNIWRKAIEETRKYKLQLVLANQSLGQIDGRGHRVDVGRSIIANVANLVAFRLGVEDAHVLARWFEPGYTAEHIMYLPDYTAVARILSRGASHAPHRVSHLPATSRTGRVKARKDRNKDIWYSLLIERWLGWLTEYDGPGFYAARRAA